MDSYNRGPQAPNLFQRHARGPSPSSPLSPQGGWGGVGGVNQSCLTDSLSVWSYDTCQVKKVNAIEGGIRLASDWHEGGMAWHGLAWSGMAWHRLY